jgi:signal transduction histidine kinase
MLAHDMRNPLAAIVANLSFLDHACRDAEREVRETLADLHASCDVLLRLIDSTVTIAALEVPDLGTAPRSRVSLRDISRTAVQAATTHGRVSLRVDERGPDAEVLADLALLTTAATHLANNGAQHSRRGAEVVLSVERRGHRAALVLSDEGPAFGPPEQHFTREAQVDLKLRTGGRYERGLGLYVVGLVAKVYGGSVETARDGVRSIVRVWFPLAPEEETP